MSGKVVYELRWEGSNLRILAASETHDEARSELRRRGFRSVVEDRQGCPVLWTLRDSRNRIWWAQQWCSVAPALADLPVDLAEWGGE